MSSQKGLADRESLPHPWEEKPRNDGVMVILRNSPLTNLTGGKIASQPEDCRLRAKPLQQRTSPGWGNGPFTNAPGSANRFYDGERCGCRSGSDQDRDQEMDMAPRLGT